MFYVIVVMVRGKDTQQSDRYLQKKFVLSYCENNWKFNWITFNY